MHVASSKQVRAQIGAVFAQECELLYRWQEIWREAPSGSHLVESRNGEARITPILLLTTVVESPQKPF